MAATQASTPSSSIYSKYAISSAWEITLQDGEVVEGLVYCADPSAGIVVLRDNADTRIISISAIRESKQTKEATTTVQPSTKDITHTKKALEEREKRAIKLAQESIKHLNPKASVKGQMIFDRLLKACNEVVWKGESIIVLQSILVDPPYEQDSCKILKAGSAQGSLDRVQKIVASVPSS